jgi:hypothetical protein
MSVALPPQKFVVPGDINLYSEKINNTKEDTASYPMRSEGYFPHDKAAGSWS